MTGSGQPGVMYCPQCGVPLPPGARFCGACGQAVPAANPQVPPSQPLPPQAAPYAPPQPAPVYAPLQPQAAAYAPPQPQAAPYAPPPPAPIYPPPQPQAAAYAPPQPPLPQPAPAHLPQISAPAIQQASDDLVHPPPPNRAWVELVRRLAAAVLLLTGIALATYRPQYVARVETVDFGSRFASDGDPRMPVSQFAASELDRYVYPVQGAEWLSLYEQVQKGSKTGKGSRLAYFGQHHPLLAGRDGIALLQDGRQRHYLRLSRESLGYISSDSLIPRKLIMPYLPYGIAIAVSALVVYLLVRWKPQPSTARYKAWVWVLMDVLGFVLCGLVAFAVGRNAGRVPWEAVGVAVAGLALSMLLLGPAMYYASLRALPLADRIRVWSLFGSRDFPYSEISLAVIRKEGQSPILGILLILFGLTNCVMAILGIAMLVRKDLRFTLARSDGKKFRIWVRTSEQLETSLLPALHQAGIQVEHLG